MLATVLLALVATSPPSPPVQSESVQQYRLELSVRSEVDLAAVGAAMQVQEQSAIGFITVTLRDSVSGRALLVVLDSATFDAGELPAPADLAAETKGATFRGFVDSAGRVRDLTPSSDNPLAAMLHSALGDFFPRTRPGATPGQQWSDTLDLVTRPAGGSLTTHLITQFTAGAAEQFHGIDASTLAATFTTQVEGTMETPAGAAGLTGSGSGTGNYYISATGIYLGGSRTTTQRSVVTLSAAGVEIPVLSTTLLVVAPLP
jgi:hypothetical protein